MQQSYRIQRPAFTVLCHILQLVHPFLSSIFCDVPRALTGWSCYRLPSITDDLQPLILQWSCYRLPSIADDSQPLILRWSCYRLSCTADDSQPLFSNEVAIGYHPQLMTYSPFFSNGVAVGYHPQLWIPGSFPGTNFLPNPEMTPSRSLFHYPPTPFSHQPAQPDPLHSFLPIPQIPH